MIEKKPLCPLRIRSITGTFAFIEHRFVHDGFLADLSHHELILYLFLVLAADRAGISFYRYDKICTLLQLTVDEYIAARNGLIDKDLIAFDGTLFQVLSLPDKPPEPASPVLKSPQEMEEHDPATVHQIIVQSLEQSYESR